MAAASPVDIAVNPANTDQRYILWGNGRIDASATAVPVTDQATWYARIDQPIAVAIWITNWATGAGYVLDLYGGIHEFGGAPDIGGGVLSGVPYTNPTRRYVDWSWDPAGTGQGIVLDQYGQLYPFGGATAAPRSGRLWSWPAAKKLQMSWSPTKYGVILDLYGGLHKDFGITGFSGGTGTYWKGKDYARDFVVTDWAAAGNPKGYKLDLYGGIHSFGGATGVVGSAVPYRPGADVARALAVLSATDPIRMVEVWSGGQQLEFVSSTPPTVVAGGGDNEQQTVAITGAPTGGTFTLTYSGQTTGAIARNATAATVDTALEALSNIGAGDVTVTGGPLPAAVTVTFTGALALTDVAQMTATSSLTGGTSPAVVIQTVTNGDPTSPPATVTDTTRPTLTWTFSDPQNNSQAGWELYVYTQAWASGHTMTDPSVWASSALFAASGINRATRGIEPDVDLPNGTYRYYVRAKDTAGQWSAWANLGWTQNIATPATPTSLSATANQSAFTVALSVTATTGGTANLVRFEYSDDAGTTWATVRGAGAVTLATTTTATDYDAKLGVTRTYRATAYALDPAIASVASATASATLTTKTFVLTAVDDPALGGRIWPETKPVWSRPIVAGVFDGLNAEYPTVVSDGRPKGRRGTIDLASLDATAYAMLDALLTADSVLVYRDPRGRVIYCRPVGDWSEAPFGAVTEVLDHVTLPLVEVAPPAA